MPNPGNRGGGKEPFLEGKLQHKGRFAFLISEVAGTADAYISGPSLSLAMDGDRVKVRLGGERNGKRPAQMRQRKSS